ncbi:Uu.00g041630.m01.CDS01 [Anthostomella pinea]|uniref:Uu.00g041630.m01.CDS01 n=1 Tax=Anthostomella pinea TaxID=933095 RepID=A0AAI8VBD7_9PEZI|nr:Uu.00g041630.m01.CDS01 [Anthostomella pinea]
MVTLKLPVILAALTLTKTAHSLPTSVNDTSLVQPVYYPLDLGSIKPLGWFKDQLELEAAGLSGNMFDFYRFVHDSKYIGGSTEYSALDEASPYWFNGLVPLAFGLGDGRIRGQVKYYLDYILDHQQADGWIGFETTQATRGLWARSLILMGLTQYAEADPTQTERIVDAMHRYVVLAHNMLKNNYTGLLVHGNDAFDTAGWGVGRTHEMHIPLQWLLERYPRDNTAIIWETMDLMIEGGVLWGADWRTFWTDGAYPKVYYDTTPYDLSWVFLHGVNMAQGLRYTLSLYRNTGDPALKAQTRKAVDLLATYHRSLAGTILADEYISDLNPSRGAELCIAAEVMFSAAYIHQYLGHNDIADWAEQTAFNAFPVSVSADWWSHQYVQQENQPWSRNLATDDLWWDVNSYGNVFGLEPNYAYPKFLANSFVTTSDGGLAHVFLIPGSAAVSLGKDGANTVFVSANTTYPFGNTITYTISATSPFSFYVRIPMWADSNTTIDAMNVAPNDKGLHKIEVPAGESTASVQLSTSPRVVPRANNTAAIYYGAILYALAIDYDEVSFAPINYRSEEVLVANTTDPLGRTKDFRLTPKAGTTWNIAIDPSQIEVVQTSSTENLNNPIWELGAPPVELRVAAVEIDWPVVLDTAADPGTFDVTPKGEPFAARFVPYGSSKLHMALLPVVRLDQVDLQV